MKFIDFRKVESGKVTLRPEVKIFIRTFETWIFHQILYKNMLRTSLNFSLKLYYTKKRIKLSNSFRSFYIRTFWIMPFLVRLKDLVIKAERGL